MLDMAALKESVMSGATTLRLKELAAKKQRQRPQLPPRSD